MSEATTVPVRPAASVVLLRTAVASGELEAYLLHRHAAMPFAAGMVVFPGGGAEPGETAEQCAVRETEEETTVRLPVTALHPWAHWITPAGQPRRYDTHFFVAVMPVGAWARDVSGETDRAAWQRPVDALADAADGRITLLPPTRAILTELAELGSWDRVLTACTDRMITTR